MVASEYRHPASLSDVAAQARTQVATRRDSVAQAHRRSSFVGLDEAKKRKATASDKQMKVSKTVVPSSFFFCIGYLLSFQLIVS